MTASASARSNDGGVLAFELDRATKDELDDSEVLALRALAPRLSAALEACRVRGGSAFRFEPRIRDARRSSP
ncbi:MAG: hypothetical protein AAFU79_04350 [Myxococcota bacterium]